MTEILQVRHGRPDDFERVLAMINEAAGWLRDKSTDQWSTPWPTRSARDERVRRGLRDGGTWMIEDQGVPIATVTYRPTGNLRLWTPGERREPSVYVSRLIVSRSHAGLGIGEALIDWAGLRALRDWSAQWIRIDVWTTNEALHNYYEKRGFGFLRTANVPMNKNAQNGARKSYPSAALFQKPTDKVDTAAVRRFADITPIGANPVDTRHARKRPQPAEPGIPASASTSRSAILSTTGR
jgi:GNAT superfamily N-acetyltransferase